MSNYPETITPEILTKFADISDEEIMQDIADTEAEIINEGKKAEGYAKVAEGTTNLYDRKMAYFRQSASEQAVKERHNFVTFLSKLLEARKAKA